MVSGQMELGLPGPKRPRRAKSAAGHGGRRPGAGRPRKGERSSEKHGRREAITRHQPVHVTIRVVREARYLRRRKVYRAIRRATWRAAVSGFFRIVHVSIQQTHVHLLVEARHADALARGMQGFEVSAARRINKAIGRRGQVFADRYHAHVLRTPSETRRALSYVLNNWCKHGEADGARGVIDPYSTGSLFEGWREFLNSPSSRPPRPRGWEELFVVEPDSWLLELGWRRHGLVGVGERPGPRRRSAALTL